MIDNLFQSLIDILLKLVIAAIPVILAITMPVAAEGWVAYKKGDTTARAQGRLTFNPIAHIDQIGTRLLNCGERGAHNSVHLSAVSIDVTSECFP